MRRPLQRKPSPVFVAFAFLTLLCASFVVANFPWDIDVQQNDPALRKQAAQEFYRQAYAEPAKVNTAREARYVEIARKAAIAADIEGMVKTFVDTHGLQDRRVLDVGAGRGYLQDVVNDYTALDISPSAERFFHKRFVLGSATAMPFRDNEFDALWSIWVLEHVPNPEQALSEMRRVVKPGGVILLAPAWFCKHWAADGYEVRPYSDFGLRGKLSKATIPARRGGAALARLPIRLIRTFWTVFENPSRFHYQRLRPNYDTYWVPDSDAVNAMDCYEAVLWFESRADQCLNCPASALGKLRMGPKPVIIRINKSDSGTKSHL